MSKSHRLAWAAGFIDGDGFITIQTRNQRIKEKQYRGHYLRVGCCQASEIPLKELQSLFGGTISVKNSGKSNYNRKPQWLWQVSTQQAKEVLEQLLPYLVHKKKVAEIGLKFQESMGTIKVSEDVWNLREELKNQIQDINAQS